MGAFKSLPRRTRSSEGDESCRRQRIVLFTGSSEKLAISYALRLASDPQKRFKALVAVSSLSSGENLSDSKTLKYLNTTLFMLQMDISTQEDVQNVVDRIKEEDGYLDAVGKRACVKIAFHIVATINLLIFRKFWAGRERSKLCCGRARRTENVVVLFALYSVEITTYGSLPRQAS